MSHNFIKLFEAMTLLYVLKRTHIIQLSRPVWIRFHAQDAGNAGKLRLDCLESCPTSAVNRQGIGLSSFSTPFASPNLVSRSNESTITEMASQAFQNLKRFTTCDIGDALVRLKYPNGGFLDGLNMFSPKPGTTIHGPAITVKMVRTNSPGAFPPVHFADANKEDHIMYIQQPKDLPSACWGGLMSTRAHKLGALGVIIDGRMRDIQEHRDIGFPVFARGTSVLGSNTFTRASEINVPLQFRGDLWIHPNDIMVGDENGVVAVPPSLVEQVVQLCQERMEIDENTLAALRAGGPMGPTIKRLRK